MIAISAPSERMSAAHAPTPAPTFSASASGASEPASLAGRRQADGDDRDEDVEQRADQQRADDREGRSRLGFSASSPDVEIASKPM